MITKLRSAAGKLSGWQSVEDVQKALKISKGSAYVYLHELASAGYVHQKIKKPRGTFYLIRQFPKPLTHTSMLAGTELASDVEEHSSEEIAAEQRVPFLINQYVKTNNSRYKFEAQRFIRKVKNWQLLYRYAKAYQVKPQLAEFYGECRKSVKKCPRMPDRYKRLLNVGGQGLS